MGHKGIRQSMVSFKEPGRTEFMKLLDEELEGFLIRFHERKGEKSEATSISLTYKRGKFK